MAMTINTNVVSINSQRNLSLSGNTLGTTMQRLSSGLRVNSAKDDAAGLAIAERMNAQSKGLAVAARNANDGISLAQTAEGALGKVGDMLQRMRELAVQSSNATNSAADREALQAEVSQLRSEIDRVAKTTSFNNQKILDGSFAGGVFQVGAGAGDNITAGGITNAKMTALGSSTYGASKFTGQTSNITDFAKATEELTIKVDGVEHKLGKLGVANSETERLGQTVAAINAKTADTGVTAFLEQGANGSFSVSLRSTSEGAVELGAGFTAASTGVAGAVTVSDIDRAAGAFKDLDDAIGNVAAAATELTVDEAKAINDALRALSKDPVLGQFASQWADAAGEIKAQTGDVSGILGDLTTAVTGVADAYDDAVAAKDAFELVGDAATVADIETYATALKALNPGGSDFEFADADDLAVAKEALSKLAQSVGFSGLNIEQAGKTKGIDKLDISTQAGAWEAMKQIDSAIDQVNAARADLGALQTRFEKAIENIDIQNENISAARGRIVDADFATETANLSRAQILQQAGTAMVAQANQLPQQVLSLLQ